MKLTDISRLALLLCLCLIFGTDADAQKYEVREVKESVIQQGNNNYLLFVRNAPQLANGEVEVSVDVVERLERDDSSDNPINAFENTEMVKVDKKEISIPASGYFRNYLTQNRILGFGSAWYGAPAFPESPLTLDIRVVNNSPKTISIKEIALDVIESKPWKLPIVYIGSSINHMFSVEFRNEGPLEIARATLAYQIYKTKTEAVKAIESGAVFPFSDTIFFKERAAVLDISKALKSHGVDVDFLKNAEGINAMTLSKHAKVFNGFTFGEHRFEGDNEPTQINLWTARREEKDDAAIQASVVGNVSFEFADGTVSSVTLFASPTYITMPGGLGDGLNSIQDSNMTLRSDARNYVLRIPVSTKTLAGDADRFLVTLRAPCTSQHTIVPRVLLSNKHTLQSDPINLLIHNPTVPAELVDHEILPKKKRWLLFD